MDFATEGPKDFPVADGNHVAGSYSSGVQRCVVCGGIIVDDRGAMIPVGSPRLQGFAPGPVHRIGNMTGCNHDDTLTDCSPL